MTTKRDRDAITTILNRRTAYATYLHTFDFQQYLEGHLANSPIRHHMRGETAQAALSQALIEQWEHGDIFTLTPAATAATQSAADTLTREILPPIFPSDLPSETGIVFPANDIHTTTTTGDNVAISAFSWSPCFTDNPTTGGAPGVLFATWTHKDANDDTLIRARQIWQEVRDQHLDLTAQLRDAERRWNRYPSPEGLTLIRNLKANIAKLGDLDATPQGKPNLPEYLLFTLQPVPFAVEYATTTTGAHRSLTATATTGPGMPIGESDSTVIRLAYALWSLWRTDHLAATPAALPPKAAQHNSKRLHGNVDVVDVVDTDLASWDMLTVQRTRNVAEPRDTYQWNITKPLCGKVV